MDVVASSLAGSPKSRWTNNLEIAQGKAEGGCFEYSAEAGFLQCASPRLTYTIIVCKFHDCVLF